MTKYRAFQVESGSTKIVRAHNFDAYDDREALQRAAQYVENYDVELWEGPRLIKRFDHHLGGLQDHGMQFDADCCEALALRIPSLARCGPHRSSYGSQPISCIPTKM